MRKIALLVVVVAFIAVGFARPAAAAGVARAYGTYTMTEDEYRTEAYSFSGTFSDGPRTYKGVVNTAQTPADFYSNPNSFTYHFHLTSAAPGAVTGTCDKTRVDYDYQIEGNSGLVFLPLVALYLLPVGYTIADLLIYSVPLIPAAYGTAFPPEKFDCHLSVHGGPVKAITMVGHFTTYLPAACRCETDRGSGVFAG